MAKIFTLFFICIIILFPHSVIAEDTESIVVINSNTREILYSKNHNIPMKMASTTKIMTAIVAIENASPTDIYTVSVNAQNQEGSSVYLRAGQKISQKELLYALMLNSGNDAAMVLAENTASGVKEFISMMNEKSKELGLKNTNFENPSGLPAENHYSTAYDMAKIMAYAMENDFFREIVSCKEYQILNENEITYLKNHNKLLWQYPYCVGDKTGFTKEAGRCLVSASQKDGKNIICVTLSCADDWEKHITLSESAFEKLSNKNIVEKHNIITTKKINSIPVNLIAENEINIALSKQTTKNLTCKILLDENINKDIFIGDKIGVAYIYYKDYHIATVGLLSGQNVKTKPKNIFLSNFKYSLKKILLDKQ